MPSPERKPTLPSKESEKHYVDLRFYFKKETEDYGDGDTYEHFEIDKVVRKKINNMTHDQLEALGESFGQIDSYHLFFESDIPTTLSEGWTSKYR
jgi:hypothetical protein